MLKGEKCIEHLMEASQEGIYCNYYYYYYY